MPIPPLSRHPNTSNQKVAPLYMFALFCSKLPSFPSSYYSSQEGHLEQKKTVMHFFWYTGATFWLLVQACGFLLLSVCCLLEEIYRACYIKIIGAMGRSQWNSVLRRGPANIGETCSPESILWVRQSGCKIFSQNSHSLPWLWTRSRTPWHHIIIELIWICLSANSSAVF